MRYATDALPLGVRRRVLALLPDGAWRRVRPWVHGEAPPQRAAVQRLRPRRRAELARSGLEVTPVRVRARVVLGEVVHRFDAEQVRTETSAAVADLLAGVGPGVLLDAGPARRSVVALPAHTRAEVARRLRAAGASVLHVAGRGGPVPVASLRSEPSGRSLLLHRVLVDAAGSVLESGALGCEVQFWDELDHDGEDSGGDPLPAGTLLAPGRNRWTDHLLPRDLAAAESREHVPWSVTEPATRPHLFDVDFDVDVVYTWVDGDDPAWLERKARAQEAAGMASRHHSAASTARYASHDELRYSLRSVEMFAGWARHVYLVTDDQVPDWLDTTQPGLTVVDHRTLFGDRGRLPTFNSHAIETQLHHIDGLSEHFLYLNDDVFLGRPVAPDLFFTGSGLTRFYPSHAKLDLGPVREGEAPVMTAAKNNRALVEREFGKVVTNKLKHAPHPLRVSVLAEMESVFADAFAATSRSQFRHPEDHSVVSALHHWYGYATGRAVPGDLRYHYANVNLPGTAARLDRLRRGRDVDAFCLNDHDAAGPVPERHRHATRFLEAYFPFPSRFERAVS